MNFQAIHMPHNSLDSQKKGVCLWALCCLGFVSYFPKPRTAAQEVKFLRMRKCDGSTINELHTTSFPLLKKSQNGESQNQQVLPVVPTVQISFSTNCKSTHIQRQDIPTQEHENILPFWKHRNQGDFCGGVCSVVNGKPKLRPQYRDN